MAKKPVSSPPSKKPATPAPAKAATSSPVRNTPLPKTGAAKPASAPSPKVAPRKEVTHAAIAQRAYEIWQSGTGGSEFDNWCRAERELRGGM
jgi:hypothetical protein